MKSDRKKIIGYARDYRVDKGHKFRLKDFDPGDDGQAEIRGRSRRRCWPKA